MKLSAAIPFITILISTCCNLQPVQAQVLIQPDSARRDTVQPDSARSDTVSKGKDTVIIQKKAADTTIIIGPVKIDTSSAKSSRIDSTVKKEATKKFDKIKEIFSGGTIFLIILLLGLTYLVNRLLFSVLDKLSERFNKYRLTIKRLIPLLRLLIWAFVIYVIISVIINPQWTTLVTVAASIGVAIGLASQDILKNIFGGFMIVFDKPFQVGDKVRIGDDYGEVKQIGLNSSQIVTPDDSEVTVPNGEFMNSSVSNANTSSLDCQVVAEIFLPADIDVDTVKRIAYKAAVSSRYVFLKKPVVIIVLNEVYEKNFVIKLRVKAYVLDIRYEFPFKSDMTELILEELNKQGLVPATEG